MKDIDAGFSKDLKTDTHMLKELKKDVQLQINELKMTMVGPQGIWTSPAQLVVSYFLGLILHLYSYALLQWVLGNSLNASSISLSCIGEEMATHSSVLAWRIPGTGEPGGLQSMGSQRGLSD